MKKHTPRLLLANTFLVGSLLFAIFLFGWVGKGNASTRPTERAITHQELAPTPANKEKEAVKPKAKCADQTAPNGTSYTAWCKKFAVGKKIDEAISCFNPKIQLKCLKSCGLCAEEPR